MNSRFKLSNDIFALGLNLSELAVYTYMSNLPFRFDSDDAGKTTAAKHCEKYSSLGYTTISHPLKHKDMNEELVAFVAKKSPPVISHSKHMRR